MEQKKGTGYAAKMKEVRAFINNVWLKDKTTFCANCGKIHRVVPIEPCCENMHITNNVQRIKDFTVMNMEDKKNLFNEFASSKDKTMRHSIRMPAELIRALQRYFRDKYGEGFLVDIKEGRYFMKEFPCFTMAERI